MSSGISVEADIVLNERTNARSNKRTMIVKPNEIMAKDRDILGGTPVFRGTRVPIQALLDYLEGGQTLDELLDDFPTVTRAVAVAALELANSLLLCQLA
jgi:uncharacterized protein (DUF433 family)